MTKAITITDVYLLQKLETDNILQYTDSSVKSFVT